MILEPILPKVEAFLNDAPKKMMVGRCKESGYGRDSSKYSIDAFTEVIAVWVSTQ